jgi:hypothetical protein
MPARGETEIDHEEHPVLRRLEHVRLGSGHDRTAGPGFPVAGSDARPAGRRVQSARLGSPRPARPCGAVHYGPDERGGLSIPLLFLAPARWTGGPDARTTTPSRCSARPRSTSPGAWSSDSPVRSFRSEFLSEHASVLLIAPPGIIDPLGRFIQMFQGACPSRRIRETVNPLLAVKIRSLVLDASALVGPPRGRIHSTENRTASWASGGGLGPELSRILPAPGEPGDCAGSRGEAGSEPPLNDCSFQGIMCSCAAARAAVSSYPEGAP